MDSPKPSMFRKIAARILGSAAAPFGPSTAPAWAALAAMACLAAMVAFPAVASAQRLRIRIVPEGSIEQTLPSETAKKVLEQYRGWCAKDAVYIPTLNGGNLHSDSLLVVTGCLLRSGEMIWTVGNAGNPTIVSEESAKQFWEAIYPHPDFSVEIEKLQ